MARISLRQLLDHAAEHGYGVPAFNINNMEQGLAIMEAASAVDAPVIMQASRGARSYANDIMLAKMIEAMAEMYPAIPLCMHQDHGNDEAICMSAIQHGFTSVMMDGSLEKADAKTPADYAYNVEITRRVADMAHWVGASVEGELGVLGLARKRPGRGRGRPWRGRRSSAQDQLLTDPDQAVDFVGRTRVDALAIAMGTSHGAYKFTRKPDGEILAMDVVEAIHARLPNTHLVMHGSSSVPQALQDIFNAAGGEMPQTWGVPVEEIARGIKHGVRKVNIDTDCRLAMTAQFRKTATNSKSEFDPRKFLKAGDGRDARPLPRALRAIRRGGPSAQDQGLATQRNGQALPLGGPRSTHKRRARRVICFITSGGRHERANEATRYPASQPNRPRQSPLPVGRDGISQNGLLGAGLHSQGYRRYCRVPDQSTRRRGRDRSCRRRGRREFDGHLDRGLDRSTYRHGKIPRQMLSGRCRAEHARAVFRLHRL